MAWVEMSEVELRAALFTRIARVNDESLWGDEHDAREIDRLVNNREQPQVAALIGAILR